MRVLGVLGTMVWDTIWREGENRAPVEEWGGISYALAAADAASPPDLRIRPVIKLGRDLAEKGFHFLRDLSALEGDGAVSVTDEPNTRVELRYDSQTRRCERIRGGLPSWTWEELDPAIDGCDALYVNFITGHEFDLSVAQKLRQRFGGPVYADIHSLLLATGPRGERSLEPLPRGSDWLRCFDIVQLNEPELSTLARGDPWKFAASVVGAEMRLLFVTLGARGVAYFAAPSALPLESRNRPVVESRGSVRTGRVAAPTIEDGDPTGCGDVWGMTCCCALLEGRRLEEALLRANVAAGRNVVHRGATGLNRFLKGELERA